MVMSKLRRAIICSIVIILLSATVFAAPIEKNIKVVYNNIKLYVNGNLIIPKDGDGNIIEPFAYKGTTYLPVRAIAEALGENVKWDGSTSSVYIGESPDGQFMSDILEPYNSNEMSYEINKTMLMGGEKYYKGYSFGIFGRPGEIYFNLNGKYTEITGLIGYQDNEEMTKFMNITILGDDNVLSEIRIEKGDLPKNLTVNVKGVNKLAIRLDGYSTRMDRIVNFANLMIK